MTPRQCARCRGSFEVSAIETYLAENWLGVLPSQCSVCRFLPNQSPPAVQEMPSPTNRSATHRAPNQGCTRDECCALTTEWLKLHGQLPLAQDFRHNAKDVGVSGAVLYRLYGDGIFGLYEDMFRRGLCTKADIERVAKQMRRNAAAQQTLYRLTRNTHMPANDAKDMGGDSDAQ